MNEQRYPSGLAIRAAPTVLPHALQGTGRREKPPDLSKAFRPNMPDSAGDRARKEAMTHAGRAPGPQKEPQQKKGTWCPACRHTHRSGSACIQTGKLPKSP